MPTECIQCHHQDHFLWAEIHCSRVFQPDSVTTPHKQLQLRQRFTAVLSRALPHSVGRPSRLVQTREPLTRSAQSLPSLGIYFTSEQPNRVTHSSANFEPRIRWLVLEDLCPCVSQQLCSAVVDHHTIVALDSAHPLKRVSIVALILRHRLFRLSFVSWFWQQTFFDVRPSSPGEPFEETAGVVEGNSASLTTSICVGLHKPSSAFNVTFRHRPCHRSQQDEMCIRSICNSRVSQHRSTGKEGRTHGRPDRAKEKPLLILIYFGAAFPSVA